MTPKLAPQLEEAVRDAFRDWQRWTSARGVDGFIALLGKEIERRSLTDLLRKQGQTHETR